MSYLALYIGLQIVIGLWFAILWVISLIIVYADYFHQLGEKNMSNFLRLARYLQFMANTIGLIYSIDPFGIWGIYDFDGMMQWCSTAITSLYVTGCAAFLWSLLQNISQMLQYDLSPAIPATFTALVVINFTSCNIAWFWAVYTGQWWPTAIFLVFNGPTLLLFTVILNVASLVLRKMLTAVADLTVGLTKSNNVVPEARKRLFIIQVCGNLFMIPAGIICIFFAVHRFKDKRTIGQALYESPNQPPAFDPFIWMQLVGLTGSQWYTWLPVSGPEWTRAKSKTSQ